MESSVLIFEINIPQPSICFLILLKRLEIASGFHIFMADCDRRKVWSGSSEPESEESDEWFEERSGNFRPRTWIRLSSLFKDEEDEENNRWRPEVWLTNVLVGRAGSDCQRRPTIIMGVPCPPVRMKILIVPCQYIYWQVFLRFGCSSCRMHGRWEGSCKWLPFSPKNLCSDQEHVSFNYEAFYKEELYMKHHDKSCRYFNTINWLAGRFSIAHTANPKDQVHSAPMIILAWTIIQSCLKLYSVFYANASSCIELDFDSAVVLLITMVMERVVPGILLVMVGCICDWKQKSQLFIPKKLVWSSRLATLPMMPLCLPWVILFSATQVESIESIRG